VGGGVGGRGGDDVYAAAEEFAWLTAEEGRARMERERAKVALREAEEAMRRTQAECMDAVRRRYHEEQVWQDKWRVLETYGTWLLIGLNSAIFLGGQALYSHREDQKLKAIASVINERTEALVMRLNYDANGGDRTDLLNSSNVLSGVGLEPSYEVGEFVNPPAEVDLHIVPSDDHAKKTSL